MLFQICLSSELTAAELQLRLLAPKILLLCIELINTQVNLTATTWYEIFNFTKGLALTNQAIYASPLAKKIKIKNLASSEQPWMDFTTSHWCDSYYLIWNFQFHKGISTEQSSHMLPHWQKNLASSEQPWMDFTCSSVFSCKFNTITTQTD